MRPGLTILGLGPGSPGLITREAWEVLERSGEVYLRTQQHPAIRELPQGIRLHSFDNLYEEMDDFEQVYRAIVDQVSALADRPQGVVYAVPGDPGLGEATVTALRERCLSAGRHLHMVHGVSFVEPCLELVGTDALDGLFVGDALDLAGRHHPPFPPDSPALLGQLHSPLLASDVKLVLMSQYPDEHSVFLIHDASTLSAKVEELPLHEMDHSRSIGGLTAVFVPALPEPSAFESFQEIVAYLRAPNGCPWDREQTHQSLRQHLLEEVYEALHALDTGDFVALREELGDLLLQVVLQSQIANEAGEFSMADVIRAIYAKLVRRHPHVFGETAVSGVEQVLHNWEALKAAEREAEGDDKGILAGVPVGLPDLAQAHEMQGRAARVGFDWPDVNGVLDKVREEIEEIKAAETSESIAAEMGDLLFALVNYARWLKLDPEAALQKANLRFRDRFESLERSVRKSGRSLSDLSLAEMDALWEQAKGDET